jgi:predicted dehydrogenase
MTSQLQVGVVGIHGFARVHLKNLLALREQGLIAGLAAVAHAREQDPAYAAELERAGVALVPDLAALLARPGLGLVTLPVGIHLHVPMTEAVLAQDLPVYLEKPVAGCLADVDRLCAHPRAARVMVGFQHLYVPSIRALRARLAAGDFGRVRRAVVTSGWPRDRAYYQRSNWAGQLTVGGTVVRDSPANNACAHHLNLAMFLCGGQPVGVRAALGRANPIPSFDTGCIQVRMSAGAEVVFSASHAGERNLGVRLRLECERATITCADLDTVPQWQVEAGSPLDIGIEPNQWSYRLAVEHLQGGSAPVCTLAEARAHAQVIEAAHRAPIVDLPGRREGAKGWTLPGIDAALDRAHAAGTGLAGIEGLVPGAETAC